MAKRGKKPVRSGARGGQNSGRDGSTSLRRLREELEARNRDLALANDRLRGLIKLRDDVLAVASHDLKTPVTTLKLISGLIRSGALAEMNDKLAKHLDIIDRSLEKMEFLVNEVMDISRLHMGESALRMERLSLNSVVEDAVAALFPQAIAKSITLDMVLDRTLPPMDGDRQRLNQLVTNLVGNALKYTSPGGAATVSTRPSGRDAVELEVRDTGCGMPAGEQKTLFERFGKGSSRATGGESSTGLGLFICKQIVDLHHGRISVESSPGRGSTFVVRLPLRAAGQGLG